MAELKDSHLILLGELKASLKDSREANEKEFVKLNQRMDALETKVDRIRYPRIKIAGGATMISLLVSAFYKYLEHKS